MPIRPVVVRAAPARTLRFQGRTALSFGVLLRQAAGGSFQPTRNTRHFMAHELV